MLNFLGAFYVGVALLLTLKLFTEWTILSIGHLNPYLVIACLICLGSCQFWIKANKIPVGDTFYRLNFAYIAAFIVFAMLGGATELIGLPAIYENDTAGIERLKKNLGNFSDLAPIAVPNIVMALYTTCLILMSLEAADRHKQKNTTGI